MQNYLTFAQNHVFLGYIYSIYYIVFSALINFLLIFLFFVCLCCFSLRACFHVLRLLSQMLRLEFHVNQRGLKRLHWSTSSRLTAPPQPISRRGAVTSLQCASLAADAQCSVHLYRWKWITVSWETYFRTGHCYMCLSVTAVRLPGDPLTLNE